MGYNIAMAVKKKQSKNMILESACKAAENELLDQRFFLLDDKQWEKFQEALQRPAWIKSGLKKLLKEKAPWE